MASADTDSMGDEEAASVAAPATASADPELRDDEEAASEAAPATVSTDPERGGDEEAVSVASPATASSDTESMDDEEAASVVAPARAKANPVPRDDEEAPSEAAPSEDEDSEAAPSQDKDTRPDEVSDESVFFRMSAKLYRYDKAANRWKERGTGVVKLLRHKNTGKVRLLMHQALTFRICANHFVGPSIKMFRHAGNEKSVVWHALDYSDGELKEETFTMRFRSVLDCNRFKHMMQKIAKSSRQREQESRDVLSTVGLLEESSIHSEQN